ncbi:acetylglutamate kinase [Candidatus Alkanophaga liquidiphilum]|nr:N-acetylglutamate kinase [Candidatus Alkanophaga liquidiphilum]
MAATMSREKILIEALPYIREFYGSTMVIKLGGHALVDEATMEDVIKDVVLLRFVGINPVVVHGGGPEITRLMERLGKQPKFVAGLRVTDDETMEIVRMVLVGSVNERIVSLISKHGGKGIGLSGNDGRLIIAEKLRRVRRGDVEEEVDLGWVGEIKAINPEVIKMVVTHGYIPVVSPIAVDEQGNSLNVNADTTAGEIAAALKAKKLIILTDVPGLLRDPRDLSTLISEISRDEARRLIKGGVVESGMLPKLEACVKAASVGVVCHIIDGRKPHSLLLELFTDAGVGTMLR